MKYNKIIVDVCICVREYQIKNINLKSKKRFIYDNTNIQLYTYYASGSLINPESSHKYASSPMS